MKTITLKFAMLSAILLVLAGTFVSCKTDEKILKPVSGLSLEINTFFEIYLPTPAIPKSECFFGEHNENKYVIINSMDELKSNILCSSITELPAINFDLYTLVIGQHQMPETYYYVVEQYFESKKSVLNIMG